MNTRRNILGGSLVVLALALSPVHGQDKAPSRLSFSIKVNDEIRQQANTNDLVLSVPELIALASSFYTLYPGDVILTGTPQGVGPVKPGDVMLASIDGIGSMKVAVRAA
jgi:2-keto-4-pentenoate hydratase/2-oxohepta-3-ene-1,7-dioic acid hydratase in catechol pathway